MIAVPICLFFGACAHEFVALARHVDEHTDLGEVADVLVDLRLFLLKRAPPAPAPAPTAPTPTPTTATTAILGNDGGLPAVRRGTGRMAGPWSEEAGAAAPLQAEQEQNGPRHRHRDAWKRWRARPEMSNFGDTGHIEWKEF